MPNERTPIRWCRTHKWIAARSNMPYCRWGVLDSRKPANEKPKRCEIVDAAVVEGGG